jgi:hypothetical protein
MSQLKPGDLALIIKSTNEENIGRVVTIVSFTCQGERIDQDNAGFSIADHGDVIVDGEIVVRRKRDKKIKHTVSRHVFSPDCLMPLRGDFAPEQQKSREVVL